MPRAARRSEENLADVASFHPEDGRRRDELACRRYPRLESQNLRGCVIAIDEGFAQWISGGSGRIGGFRPGATGDHGFAAFKNGVVLSFRRICGGCDEHKAKHTQVSHARSPMVAIPANYTEFWDCNVEPRLKAGFIGRSSGSG